VTERIRFLSEFGDGVHPVTDRIRFLSEFGG
jgi:hypothetical protein